MQSKTNRSFLSQGDKRQLKINQQIQGRRRSTLMTLRKVQDLICFSQSLTKEWYQPRGDNKMNRRREWLLHQIAAMEMKKLRFYTRSLSQRQEGRSHKLRRKMSRNLKMRRFLAVLVWISFLQSLMRKWSTRSQLQSRNHKALMMMHLRSLSTRRNHRQRKIQRTESSLWRS